MTTFLDSNIWIYALNQSQDIRKHQIANHLAIQTGLYLSTQVINEVCVNLIKKGKFPENQIQNLIQGFYQIHHIVELDLNILLKASVLRTKYLFSFWDRCYNHLGRFDIMNLKPIRTEADYQQALKEIEQIFEAEPNTPEYEKLDILTTLVEVYEQQNYPIEPPSPIAAILYYLESRNQGISTFIENLKHHGVSEEIINTALNEMTHG